MKILLTGGAGYIGSHTAIALVEAGFEPVVLDNFANSHPVVMERLQRITGQALPLERGDVLDTPWLTEVLRRHRPAGVGQNASERLARNFHLRGRLVLPQPFEVGQPQSFAALDRQVDFVEEPRRNSLGFEQPHTGLGIHHSAFSGARHAAPIVELSF